MSNLSSLCVFFLMVIVICSKYFLVSGNRADVDSLVSVITFSRHGDRSPEISYPKDPLNISWPVGKGQLLNSGKKRLYKLGQWFREYLTGFLPEVYSEKDINVKAIEKGRILMSAELVLAGLYSPKNDQIWNENLLWQPIPVYNLPDHLIYTALSKNCPRYLNKWKSHMKSSKFFNSDEAKEFFEYISNNTGIPLDKYHLIQLGYIWDVLLVQNENGYTLPKWAEQIYPEKFNEIIYKMYDCYAFDDEMIRLSIGGFLNDLINHFDSFFNGKNVGKPNLKMFFGQDVNIVKILKGLGSYSNHIVDYGATLIFELHQFNGEYFVQLYYLMDTDDNLIAMRIGECPLNCPLSDLKKILKKYLIPNEKVWVNECNSGASIFKEQLMICFISMLIVLLSFYFSFKQ